MTSKQVRSCLLHGVVRHHRLSPKRHSLTYRVFNLLIDLDDLPALDKSCRLFGWNRGGLVSFRDCDYGAGGDNLKARITTLCHDAGCPVTRVALLCFPRLWGYLFNPLSVYLCSDGAGQICAVVYEVSNTFGQRHSYVFPHLSPEQGGHFPRHSCRKNFYVSPFLPMEADYSFRLSLPCADTDAPLRLAIGYHGHGGGDRLNAVLVARPVPLSDGAIARAVMRHPALTVKVIAGIHWEALKLWTKGLPLFHRPSPPARAYSVAPQQAPQKTGQLHE